MLEEQEENVRPTYSQSDKTGGEKGGELSRPKPTDSPQPTRLPTPLRNREMMVVAATKCNKRNLKHTIEGHSTLVQPLSHRVHLARARARCRHPPHLPATVVLNLLTEHLYNRIGTLSTMPHHILPVVFILINVANLT
ncbi:hypothetical protein S83_032622 [Arachis hypogaea]